MIPCPGLRPLANGLFRGSPGPVRCQLWHGMVQCSKHRQITVLHLGPAPIGQDQKAMRGIYFAGAKVTVDNRQEGVHREM